VQHAKKQGADMIFFPEAFDFVGHSVEFNEKNAEPLDGPLMTRYRELARPTCPTETGIWISYGGFHEKKIVPVAYIILM